MNVLLSIRPEYVVKILEGTKRYEFRKTKFNGEVSKIYLYCTAPVRKIVGVIFIENILADRPTNLWEMCNGMSGISKTDFFQYFNGSKKGYAIEFNKIAIFQKPIDPNELFENFTAPQSFFYFEDEVIAPKNYEVIELKNGRA